VKPENLPQGNAVLEIGERWTENLFTSENKVLDPNERWNYKKNKLDCGTGNRRNCGNL
jgi:hypothetical protein